MRRWQGLAVRGALVLMESLWVYALVAMLVAITVGGGKPSFLGVAAVVLASFAISRGLQGSSFSLGVLRFWGALLSLLVFYAIVRVDFYGDFRFWDFSFADALFNHTEATLRDDATAIIGVPLLAAFWVRGVLRGQQSIQFEDVVRSFAVGVLVVAFAELFAGINRDLPREVDYVAVPYIAAGLFAIGLAHASRASEEFSQPFSSVWLLAIGGAVLGLALFAMLFVLIDFQTAQDIFIFVGRGLGFVIAGVFYVILWPVLKVVELGFEVMKWFIHLYGGTRNEPQQQPTGASGAQNNQQGDNSILPGWVDLLVRILVGGGLFTALVIGLALLFTRFKKEPKPGEVRESTYQEGRLANDLSNLIGSVLGRLRGRGNAGAGETEPARRLYFEMLSAAAARGIERRPMETPLELAPRISRTFGAQTPGEITRLFESVRYGQIPPSDAELHRLRDDWERIPK